MNLRAPILFSSLAALIACSQRSTSGGGADAAAEDATAEEDAREESPDAVPLDMGAIDVGPPIIHVRALDDGLEGSGTEADPYRELQTAIDAAPSEATIQISSGTYRAEASEATEAYCGNCGEHMTSISFTRGFFVTGKSLSIVGDAVDPRNVQLETRAGYGFMIEDAGEVRISGVTITGGVRDEDGRATSAAVVVRNSTVSLEHVWIARNQGLGPNGEYPGIAGVAGREGADIRMRSSLVYDNSWDGFVLYRGARGMVVDTKVDRGNGVGIGATWDAELTAINNRVSGYWKGLGGFGRSKVVAQNNVVFANVTWGVWLAGEDGARFELINNTVVHQGNCSMAVNAGVDATIRNNLLVFGGRSAPQICPNVGIWLFAANRAYDIQYNILFGHPLAEVWLGGEQPTGDNGSDISGGFIDHDGNVSIDPLLVEGDSYGLDPSSPAIDGGDPAILDLDGSRSDIGHLGGPRAGLTVFPE